MLMLHRFLSPLRNVAMSFSTKVPPKAPLIIVLGATGTGKSQLAIDLSLRFNGEIINSDAMQLYHGLPIVTNKVTPLETKNIPHHLLSEIPLSAEPWRVGVFKKRAGEVIREIRGRGRIPVLVGGTHYYLQSLVLGGLVGDEGVEGEGGGEKGVGMSFEEINKKWPVLEGSTEGMLEMLKEVDPVMAERWHPKDRRKIRRSLEIYLMSGRKASDVYAEQAIKKDIGEGDGEGEVDLSSTLFFWVHAESNVLKERLDGRIDKMLTNGMLEEVNSMSSYLSTQKELGNTIDRTRGIWVSIGWKEFEPYLNALNSSPPTSEQELQTLFDTSIEQIKAATRQYAKRQTRWIKLKLLPALKEQGALKQLYLLDGTDITSFQSKVIDPAIEITTAFLAEKEMLDPETVCVAAKEILGEAKMEEGEEGARWERKECEICGTVGVTEVQWETHLKSRKHRGAVKRVQKRQRDGVRVRSSAQVTNAEESSGEDAEGTP